MLSDVSQCSRSVHSCELRAMRCDAERMSGDARSVLRWGKRRTCN